MSAATLPKGAGASPSVPPLRGPRQSWLLCVPAALIACCVLVGARMYLDVASLSPRVLYSRVIASTSLCPSGVPPGGLAIEAWRAAAQLNASRWQYANVSMSTFPDGSPVRHVITPSANVWGLAKSGSWEHETFK